MEIGVIVVIIAIAFVLFKQFSKKENFHGRNHKSQCNPYLQGSCHEHFSGCGKNHKSQCDPNLQGSCHENFSGCGNCDCSGNSKEKK